MSNNQNKKALLSGFWYTSSNILVKSLTFITTPIFTRLLSQEEYGAFSNYASWTSILIILTTLNVESTLISAKFDYKERLNQYILSVLCLSFFSIIIWAFLSNLFIYRLSNILNMSPLYIETIFIYCIFYLVINVFQINERFQYEYKKSVIISLSLAILTTVVSILLVINMDNRLMGRILGNVLPAVLIGSILLFMIIKKGSKIDFSMWKYALKICIPYIPHLLSLILLHSIDRIMITKICGEVDNAIYSVAFMVGVIITTFGHSINQAFSPWLGDNLNLRKYKVIRNVSKYYIGLFVIFVIGLILIAPEIILFFGGEQYYKSIYVFLPISLGCILQFIYTLFVNVEQFKKKTIWMAIASVLVAVINYLLNYMFIPIYGYESAAYTTFVSYLFLLIFHMIIVWKIGLYQIYSYKFIVWIVFVLTILSIAIHFLYSYSILRYIILLTYIVILTIIALKYKSIIFELFKRKTIKS